MGQGWLPAAQRTLSGADSQGVFRLELVEFTRLMQIHIWQSWRRAQHRDNGSHPCTLSLKVTQLSFFPYVSGTPPESLSLCQSPQ